MPIRLLTAALLSLVLALPALAAKPELKERKFEDLGFKLELPEDAKDVPMTDEEKKQAQEQGFTALTLGDATLRVQRWDDQRKLDEVVEGFEKQAKDRKWKVVKSYKTTIGELEARVIMVKSTSDKDPKVAVQTMFYFLNAAGKHWMMAFGAADKAFEERPLAKIAKTFATL